MLHSMRWPLKSYINTMKCTTLDSQKWNASVLLCCIMLVYMSPPKKARLCYNNNKKKPLYRANLQPDSQILHCYWLSCYDLQNYPPRTKFDQPVCWTLGVLFLLVFSPQERLWLWLLCLERIDWSWKSKKAEREEVETTAHILNMLSP